MDSSAALRTCGFPVPKVYPKMAAFISPCHQGAPSPAIAGTTYTAPLSYTVTASSSASSGEQIICNLCSNHLIVPPVQ